jgi:hypothetical protein
MQIQIKSLQEIREETPGLNQPGDWLIINIEPRMAWPVVAQSFKFDEHELWLIPITDSCYPGLAVRNSKLKRDATFAMLYRALSVISWLEGDGATVVSRGGGSPLFPAYGARRKSNFIQQGAFDLTELPVIESDVAKFALALIREGRGLNHPAYSFLSFYRVIERAIPDGTARGVWMTDAIQRISDHEASDALAKLRESCVGDIGKHLYDSGRSAVAHASREPVANPDNPKDYERLDRERPIIEALAVMAIEEIFGIQTQQTVWREHLYELRGWKHRFPPELIQRIIEGRTPDEGQEVDIPTINMRLRCSEPFEPLESLQPTGWTIHDCKAVLQFQSRDGYARAAVLLDFAAERLIFPIDIGLEFDDDGTVEAAQTGRILTTFVHAYNCNGELQIWNADDGSLLSKCDAFIPVNVIFRPEGAKAELLRWDSEIERRISVTTEFGGS